jgi:hypothetical protein
MGGDIHGVANLGFLAGETIVGILHRSAHIYPAYAYFQVYLVYNNAHPWGRREGIFVISLRIKTLRIPTTGHGAEIFGKAQGIHVPSGIERKGSVRRWEGNFGRGG